MARASSQSSNPDRTAAEAVFDRSFAPQAPLYAVLDPASAPTGPHVARQVGARCESLFAGAMGEELSGVAPHLVWFRADSPFRRWWFDQWGNSIGILVEAAVTLPELRKHFRKLLIVNGEGRKRYYFRFYDPRVLRVFLPCCTSAELEQFVGPIKAFYCESAGGEELLAFRFEAD